MLQKKILFLFLILSLFFISLFANSSKTFAQSVLTPEQISAYQDFVVYYSDVIPGQCYAFKLYSLKAGQYLPPQPGSVSTSCYKDREIYFSSFPSQANDNIFAVQGLEEGDYSLTLYQKVCILPFDQGCSLQQKTINNFTVAQSGITPKVTPSPSPTPTSMPKGPQGACVARVNCSRTEYPVCYENFEPCNPPGCAEKSLQPDGTVKTDCAYKQNEAPRVTPARTKPQSSTLISNCPVCPGGYTWSQYNTCQNINNGTDFKEPITKVDCSSYSVCYPGSGCSINNAKIIPNVTPVCPGGICETALGPIPVSQGPLINKIFGLILGISGGVALLLIILSGYQMIASQGNPEKLQGARDTLTSAIVGLLFIIFSMVILEVIGVDLLNIPGFGK